jgi:uncharacterized protein (TIGR02246 family)
VTEQDRKAIESIVAEMEKAWNAGDGSAFARHFAEDADFVNVFGFHGKGRKAIADAHDRILSTVYKGSVNRYVVRQARMLAPGVALAHIRATLDVPIGPPSGRLEALPSGVFVCDTGEWKIAAFHNTLIQEPPSTHNHGQPR